MKRFDIGDTAIVLENHYTKERGYVGHKVKIIELNPEEFDYRVRFFESGETDMLYDDELDAVCDNRISQDADNLPLSLQKALENELQDNIDTLTNELCRLNEAVVSVKNKLEELLKVKEAFQTSIDYLKRIRK
jgi:Tfp pilus assembly protein PilE